MKPEAKFVKLPFHTVCIAFVMMSFSLLCWFNLLLGIIDYVDRHSSAGNEIGVSEGMDFDERVETSEEISFDQNIEASSNITALNQQDWLQTVMAKIDIAWDQYIYKREELSRIDALGTYMMIDEILSSEVIYGSDNWLFYKSKKYGSDLIADYEGTNPYTDAEMKNILRASLSVQNRLADRGINFVIFVPPNKENVYSEFMPNIYKHAETSSTDLLIEYLSERGVNIINPKEALLIYHAEYQLYYSYDTHWNQLGAYIGVKSILDTWGMDVSPIYERTILQKELKGNYHEGAVDDLAAIVGLRSKFDDDIEYEIEGTLTMDWKQYQEIQGNQQVSHYENPHAQNDGTLFLVGDSFRSAMIPALREVYKNVYIAYIDYFKPEMLDEINPDYVIVEYVEKYSRNMANIDDLFQ